MAKKSTKKTKPKKATPQDGGITPKQRQQLTSAIRQVWSWSAARRICIARATDKAGWARCEGCLKRVPKVFADHIEPAGDLLSRDYLVRMFRPSKHLQNLCKKCHDAKTRLERDQAARGF